jgi:BRCA1-associated protein
MVCDRVGCGRYKNADAFKHFQKTGHIYSMDLETQRVWNYLSDSFCHRIIPLLKQEVTLKFPDSSSYKKDTMAEESLEGAFWQYCSVVSEELERQRAFYEKMKIEER